MSKSVSDLCRGHGFGTPSRCGAGLSQPTSLTGVRGPGDPEGGAQGDSHDCNGGKRGGNLQNSSLSRPEASPGRETFHRQQGGAAGKKGVNPWQHVEESSGTSAQNSILFLSNASA